MSFDGEKPVQAGKREARGLPGELSATSEKDKRKKVKALEKLKSKGKKKGVCYLSSIPPHMKPLKLRQMLSQHAEVLRVYLAPEDPSVRAHRKKSGGNRGKNFTEGWVEFADKREAKRVASLLNGEPMGGKRRSAYHFDLWNIKYLKKFKWDNLTEEKAYQNAVREQKLEAEIRASNKEREFYLSKVDQSRAIRAMQERKRKRLEEEGTEREGAEGRGNGEGIEAGERESRSADRGEGRRERGVQEGNRNEDRREGSFSNEAVDTMSQPKRSKESSEGNAGRSKNKMTVNVFEGGVRKTEERADKGGGKEGKRILRTFSQRTGVMEGQNKEKRLLSRDVLAGFLGL